MIKKLIILAVITTGLFSKIYNLNPIEITKDIHCVIGDFNPPKKSNNGFVSNVCYVDLGDSIVLLDAGATYIFAKELHELIKKEYPNKKISYVVLSNYHDDRVQGASYFKELGAKIVGHKSINEDIKNNPEKFERMHNILDKSVMKHTKVIMADTLVDDGYKIKGSKKSLIILKPSKVSEERSDIAIYSPKDSFVFAGNIIFNGRMLNYTSHSNVDGWIKAINKIESLKPKYILGGHGKEYDRNSYKASLNYLQTLKKDVKKAYDKEIDAMDVNISKTIYEEQNIPYFKELNRNNINHYYEQLEFEN